MSAEATFLDSFRSTFQDGIILTKYSRKNVAQKRLVFSPAARQISWRPVHSSARDRFAGWRHHKTYEMTALRLILVGSSSEDWFDVETQPPPFSFVIITPSRSIYLTAPDLQTYISCVQGFEGILAENSTDLKSKRPSNAVSGKGGKKEECDRKPLSSEVTTELSLTGLQVSDFLGLYDQVLVTTTQDVSLDSWRTSDYNGICSLLRRVATSHETNFLGVRSELSVRKFMSAFVEPSSCDGDVSLGRVLILEENSFSGVPCCDHVNVIVRWIVTPYDDGNLACAVTCGIEVVKDTLLSSRICSEVVKGFHYGLSRWEALARRSIETRLKCGDSDVACEDEAIWHGGGAAMAQLVANCTTQKHSDDAAFKRAREAVREAAQTPELQALLASPFGVRALTEHSLTSDNPAEETKTERNADVPELPPRFIEGFICPECGSLSKSPGELVAHFTVFHSEEVTGRADGGGHTDDRLPQSTATSWGASEHSFLCPECYQDFQTPDALSTHYHHSHEGKENNSPRSEDFVPSEDITDYVMSSFSPLANVFVSSFSGDPSVDSNR